MKKQLDRFFEGRNPVEIGLYSAIIGSVAIVALVVHDDSDPSEKMPQQPATSISGEATQPVEGYPELVTKGNDIGDMRATEFRCGMLDVNFIETTDDYAVVNFIVEYDARDTVNPALKDKILTPDITYQFSPPATDIINNSDVVFSAGQVYSVTATVANPETKVVGDTSPDCMIKIGSTSDLQSVA